MGLACTILAASYFAAFIILEVQHVQDGRWVLVAATLSAHWQMPTDNTATYSYPDLEFAETFRGRPRVWVAENKHANYRSKSVCDAGAGYADNCDNGQDLGLTLEILSSTNIGHAFYAGRQLLNCVNSRRGYPGRECFWNGSSNFHGWLTRSGEGSGPYEQSLRFFGFN